MIKWKGYEVITMPYVSDDGQIVEPNEFARKLQKIKAAWNIDFETGYMEKIPGGYKINIEKSQEAEKRKKIAYAKIDEVFDKLP